MRQFLLLAISLIVLDQPSIGAEPAKPNIVIILADDLGYGDLSCQGATRVQTPNVDRLAREGVRFTDAHAAAATCTPSRYALLTGEYAWRKKGTGVLPGNAALIIERGRATLASMLQQAGYRTAAVGKWHLGLGRGNVNWNGDLTPGPLEIGFNYSFIIPATGDRTPCVFVENHRVAGLEASDPMQVSYSQPLTNEPTGKDHPELLKMRPSHGHDQTIINGISRIGYMSGGKAARWVDEDIADVITGQAVKFIEQNKDHPFFLYFATHDIHVPRVPHPRFVGKTDLGPRGDVITEFDWSTGEILKTLDRLKLTENTLVLLSSDNGPVVDDGYQDQAKERLGNHRPAGQLRGGKYSIFEGGTRIPLIVRWPARVKPGTSDALICQVDFLASLAALTGQKLGPQTGPDSLDTLSALLGESSQGRADLVEQAGPLALRQANWKFIEPGKGARRNLNTNTETGQDPQGQLYELGRDLGEMQNLTSHQPERVKSMGARLNAIRSQDKSP